VNEFIEECRREWRRLGVPDPIANEMAADLTADIEEAEAEGGSAEDVLGNSLFDPRRFAAAWAGARGVTAPSPPPSSPPPPSPRDDAPRRRGLAVALTALGAFFALAAVALLIGRRSASAAMTVRRILPGPAHLLGPGPVIPPLRFFAFGPQISVQNNGLFVLFAALMLLFGVVALGLAVMCWSPWSRRKLNVIARVTGRTKGSERSSG
jgi:hypothetical protein